MKNKNKDYKITSYGIYSQWNRQSKDLPIISKFTLTIPSRLDIEFGYILNIKKSRGKKLDFCIDHPPFLDKYGKLDPPFTGSVYIRSNNWDFYLGDTIWLPLEDKLGKWKLTCQIDGKIIAEKTFTIIPESSELGY